MLAAVPALADAAAGAALASANGAVYAALAASTDAGPATVEGSDWWAVGGALPIDLGAAVPGRAVNGAGGAATGVPHTNAAFMVTVIYAVAFLPHIAVSVVLCDGVVIGVDGATMNDDSGRGMSAI